jgi:hypothetical protein
MGKVVEESVTESQVPEQTKKSVLFAAIMLIIGLFAPILIDAFGTNSPSPIVVIVGMFWEYRFTSSPYIPAGFALLIDSSSWTVMFPFLLLRMVPVRQIFRYYNGKTTRIRVVIASVIGDGLYLFVGIMMAFSIFATQSDRFHLPLPFQIIFSIFVLLIFRGSKPPVTWENKQSTKSWWEKSPEPDQE